MGKLTAAQIISEAVVAKQSVKAILAKVIKSIPESRADETHVKYYARKMLTAGALSAEDALEHYNVKPPKSRKSKVDAAEIPEKKPRITRKKKGPRKKKQVSIEEKPIIKSRRLRESGKKLSRRTKNKSLFK